jgi:hypothetical protein
VNHSARNCAGGDIAARCPYHQIKTPSKSVPQKFYKAKAGQTDLGCGIFPVLLKDRDELIYGGPEKFNQSKGG